MEENKEVRENVFLVLSLLPTVDGSVGVSESGDRVMFAIYPVSLSLKLSKVLQLLRKVTGIEYKLVDVAIDEGMIYIELGVKE